MATKKEKPTEETAVKELNTSNLSEAELKEAIEKQASQSQVSSSSAKTKQAQTTNAAAETPEKANANEKEEDKGIPIIVKNRSSYMRKASDSGGETEATEESASKELKPPSQASQPQFKPSGQLKPEPGKHAEEKGDEETEAAVAEPANTEADKSNESDQETTGAAGDLKTTSADEADGSSTGSKGNEVLQKPEPATEAHEEDEASELQKPTVYDTTQYHVPIKANPKHYVSNAIAWTILALAFIGIGGYVMYRLGVIDISSLFAL